MNLQIEQVQRHRNGIFGAPFHALLFSDPREGRMIGIVFEQEWHTAVLHLDKLACGNITFGENSWRGDQYEPFLRQAIRISSTTNSAMTNTNRLEGHTYPPTKQGKETTMKKYHVKVAVQILEIYEIEAEDAEMASDDWSFGDLISTDDEALESIVLSVTEA